MTKNFVDAFATEDEAKKAIRIQNKTLNQSFEALFTRSKLPGFAESEDCSVCAAFKPELRNSDEVGHPLDIDPSLVIVDYLGLKTLTFPHEFGHALGLDHHNFARVGTKRATLMVANGTYNNPKGFARAPYWSDSTKVIEGGKLKPTEGEDDVQVIDRHIPLIFSRRTQIFR